MCVAFCYVLFTFLSMYILKLLDKSSERHLRNWKLKIFRRADLILLLIILMCVWKGPQIKVKSEINIKTPHELTMGPEIITWPCNLYCFLWIFIIASLIKFSLLNDWFFLSICYLEDKIKPTFCFFKLGYLVYLALYLLVKLCGKATASYSIVQWNASVISSCYGS
jgi:hypothetical protein